MKITKEKTGKILFIFTSSKNKTHPPIICYLLKKPLIQMSGCVFGLGISTNDEISMTNILGVTHFREILGVWWAGFATQALISSSNFVSPMYY
jgi:hypothetical protein